MDIDRECLEMKKREWENPHVPNEGKYVSQVLNIDGEIRS